MRSSSEGANFQLELMYCWAVELSELLAPGNVPALELSEWVAVHDLIDHDLEVSACSLDLLGDLAVQLAAVSGKSDASARQEAQLLAETVEVAFRHGGNPAVPGRKNHEPLVSQRGCTAEEGQQKSPHPQKRVRACGRGRMWRLRRRVAPSG